MMMRLTSLLAALAVAGALAGCTATTNPDSLAQNDPYEPTNRAIFAVNQKIDDNFARPVAVFYNHAVPGLARDGVHNFLYNLNLPVTFANDVLQCEGKRASQTFGRFALNSTLGLGGLMDVASKMGVPDHSEDFGQTLGVYGVGEGHYFVAPFIGPAPPRDLAGGIVDIFTDPLNYTRFHGYYTAMAIRTGMSVLDTRARNVDTLDQIERSSVDYYATQRSLYRQYRNSEIRNGKPDTQDLPNL
jgi:phospholipid-binding lipoprotein MlaA